jgi:putative addiction module component (TIGR02574 family)
MRAIEELRALPVAERIQLVEDLWDSIAEDAGSFQVTEAQRKELDRRLDDFEAYPVAGAPWEQVRDSLRPKP